ncbi:MAG: DUF1045 domain-containing protein [Proteobacteria bacterium]|nr:DUF1045 domain-containing protein [Pseudomonadota bacterium]
MTWRRYGLYWLPDPGTEPWARRATDWLGWDAVAGAPCGLPEGLPPLPLPWAEITATPRRYGLHATLKPPFHLADGCTEDALRDACARLAAGCAPVALPGLALTPLGRFLALTVPGDQSGLSRLAAACVRGVDEFRAPASEEELARRRMAGLSAEEDANLLRWGYPYVMERFRFHVTLTGRLSRAEVAEVTARLQDWLMPLMPASLHIADIALVGEDADGHLHLVERFALTG